MVYLTLRIVSITLTSKVLDVLAVAGGGGGSDLPPVGIKPAKTEGDNAHMSITATANFFIVLVWLLWRVRKDAEILT